MKAWWNWRELSSGEGAGGGRARKPSPWKPEATQKDYKIKMIQIRKYLIKVSRKCTLLSILKSVPSDSPGRYRASDGRESDSLTNTTTDPQVVSWYSSRCLNTSVLAQWCCSHAHSSVWATPHHLCLGNACPIIWTPYWILPLYFHFKK